MNNVNNASITSQGIGSPAKKFFSSWITDLVLNGETIANIVVCGRARWSIENETFNTLKNLGYNFEHNYGHGKQHLSSVFCLLMMLAFLVDQIQEIACSLYVAAKKAAGTYRELWQSMRTLFEFVHLNDWQQFYRIIAKEIHISVDST